MWVGLMNTIARDWWACMQARRQSCCPEGRVIILRQVSTTGRSCPYTRGANTHPASGNSPSEILYDYQWSYICSINIATVKVCSNKSLHVSSLDRHSLRNKTFELMLTRRAKAYSSQFLFANCQTISPAISSQFILGVCAAAEDRKNQ